MSDYYQPESDFLKWVIAGDVPLSGSSFAEANLRKLIELTNDNVFSNRDWATFLLSQTDIDTAEVRAALHLRLHDECEVVQEEAMVGLASRRDISALPVLLSWMREDGLSKIILEAAAEFAEPSLLQPLSEHRKWAEDEEQQDLWQEAWDKCASTSSSA